MKKQGGRLRKQFGLSPDRNIVLLFDDLSKGSVNRAYCKMAKALPEVSFLWMNPEDSRGTGDAYRELSNVYQLEDLTAEDCREVYQGCDVAVSLGNQDEALLEAMACGAPVLLQDGDRLDGSLRNRNCAYFLQENESVEDGLRRVLQSDQTLVRKEARDYAKERDLIQIQKIMRQIYDIENLEEGYEE